MLSQWRNWTLTCYLQRCEQLDFEVSKIMDSTSRRIGDVRSERVAVCADNLSCPRELFVASDDSVFFITHAVNLTKEC